MQALCQAKTPLEGKLSQENPSFQQYSLRLFTLDLPSTPSQPLRISTSFQQLRLGQQLTATSSFWQQRNLGDFVLPIQNTKHRERGTKISIFPFSLDFPKLAFTSASWQQTSHSFPVTRELCTFSQLQEISNLCEIMMLQMNLMSLLLQASCEVEQGPQANLIFFQADMLWRIHKLYLTQYLTFLHDSKAE